jgi:branched-chain amino acid transport system substrate-binding protein
MTRAVIRCLFALSLLVLSVTGQSARAEPGVTDTEIRIGMWTPLTGPTSLLGQSTRDAVQLWANEVNEKGGLNGRKIKLIVYDDAGSPQEAQAAIRRLIDQDDVFMLLGGSTSGSTLPVRQIIAKDKVPFIASISSNNNLLNPFSRYIFRIFANETSMASGIVDWMMTKESIKRPAIIYTSNDYGIGGYQEFKELLETKYKQPPVAAERYNPGDQDFTAQLLRIKAANPDGLLVYAFAQEAGIIVRQAKELGLTAKMFGGGGTSTPLFQRGAGNAAIGFISVLVVPEIPEHSTKPEVVAYRDKLKAALYPNGFPPGRPSEYDMLGYATAKAAEAAILKAGKDLTREAVVDALETMQNFDVGTTFPVSYSKTEHNGTPHVELLRVEPDLEWRSIGQN